MIDAKTNHLGLLLPNQKNDLREDCPRIKESFVMLDAHAEATDGRLDEAEAGVSSLEARAAHNEADAAAYAEQTDVALAGLGNRATALEGRTTELEGGVTALAAAALFFLPSVFYDRRAKREESLTYTILRLF